MSRIARSMTGTIGRPNEWQPNRPTIAVRARREIGLTLFELTEHVRVRQYGCGPLCPHQRPAATRRYAPQVPGEADETRDMPTGRFVLRAYSPRHDAPWQREWTESQKGEFVTMANAIANALEEAVPVIMKQVEDAEQRRREQEGAGENRTPPPSGARTCRSAAAGKAGGERRAAFDRQGVERRLRARGVLHRTLPPCVDARRRRTREP